MLQNVYSFLNFAQISKFQNFAQIQNREIIQNVVVNTGGFKVLSIFS